LSAPLDAGTDSYFPGCSGPTSPRSDRQETLETLTPSAAASRREGAQSELLAAGAIARRLAGRLLATPRAERLGLLATDAVYRQVEIARLLALCAAGRLDAPPPEAEEVSELALAVAIALAPAPGENGRLRGLCRWLLGKAQLRAGRPAAAEASFAAIGADGDGELGAGERALADVGMAQLRWQQRRLPEAWVLLSAAARAFAEVHDAPAAGACRSLAGFLLLASDEPMMARLELRAAHRELGRVEAPSLSVLVCLGLAHCDALLAGPAAEDFLLIAAEAARACKAPAPALGAWWSAVLGLEGEATEGQLEAARRDALDRGEAAAAARLTLEQALRRIAAGDGASAACLSEPLGMLGPEGEIWSQEIAALAPVAGARPEDSLRAAQELALRLAVPAIPRLAAEGLPWPVCDLADRLLLLRLEVGVPIGAAPGR
jgi:hypothetical protein